ERKSRRDPPRQDRRDQPTGKPARALRGARGDKGPETFGQSRHGGDVRRLRVPAPLPVRGQVPGRKPEGTPYSSGLQRSAFGPVASGRRRGRRGGDGYGNLRLQGALGADRKGGFRG